MRADQVIIEPVLSEKSNIAREQECKKYGRQGKGGSLQPSDR